MLSPDACNSLGWTFQNIGRYWHFITKGDAARAGYLAWQMRGCRGSKWVECNDPGFAELRKKTRVPQLGAYEA